MASGWNKTMKSGKSGGTDTDKLFLKKLETK